MGIHLRVLASIAVILGLVCLVVLLRRLGVVKEDQGKFFASLVMDITLPALIFVSLARQSLHWPCARSTLVTALKGPLVAP